MSPKEKAQEIVSEWLHADFRGEVSVAGRGMLESLIAAAFADERTRALEDAAKIVDDNNTHYPEYIDADYAALIRALKAKP